MFDGRPEHCQEFSTFRNLRLNMFVPIQFIIQHHPKVGHAVFRCDFNTIHGKFFT